tara:strand:- start:56 stop:757 length:702 start_codon:yes stop_codon:yes gene_type:complete
MNNNQVCMPMFYFSLLILSLFASVLFLAYQFIVNGGLNINSPTLMQPSLNPYSTPYSNSPPPPSPPISPDQADDLALGELPPRRRDYRKFNDPLKEPSRRYTQYPNGITPPITDGNINIATQGYLPSYQLMGYLRKDRVKPDKSGNGSKDKSASRQREDPDRMLKLFGRRIDSYRYEYYVTHHDDSSSLKIPLKRRGDREINDGDEISVPGYPGNFTVDLYDYESPKYIPYLF